jgi:hypothetical protein
MCVERPIRGATGKLRMLPEEVTPVPGQPGKLVDRRERDTRVTGNDGFGAVAMMRVEIPNRHSPGAVIERIECGDGDVIEITKPHRPILRRVMARRPHQAKRLLADQRATPHLHRRAGRAGRVRVDVRVGRAIVIEVIAGEADGVQMGCGMRTLQRQAIGHRRLAPFPIRVPIMQQLRAPDDALRLVGMSRARELADGDRGR